MIPRLQPPVEELLSDSAAPATRSAGTATLMGGNPRNHGPDLWRTLGADGLAQDAQPAMISGSPLRKRGQA